LQYPFAERTLRRWSVQSARCPDENQRFASCDQNCCGKNQYSVTNHIRLLICLSSGLTDDSGAVLWIACCISERSAFQSKHCAAKADHPAGERIDGEDFPLASSGVARRERRLKGTR
jgi:hypothetical protein